MSTAGSSTGSSWAGPSPGRAGKLAVRAVRHLTRRTALVSLMLAAVASLAATVADPKSAVGEVLLVIVGILISVVVLPESPHKLWNVTAEDLADTVPSDHLLRASRAIALAISRQSDGPVMPHVIGELWDDALVGVGRIVEDPTRVLLDVDYRIQVIPEPNQPPIVATSISSKRCVPGAREDVVWFSFCSNHEALNAEYAEHGSGCISRELIDCWSDEDLDDWVTRVCAYPVDLVVDGRPSQRRPSQTIAGSNWRVVRVPFDAGILRERFVPTELAVEFHADPGQRRFPVKFGSYFVVGATQVTFEVADAEARIECDEYLASATRAVSLTNSSSRRGCGVRIRASAGTVLPPGAGVLFSWENRPMPGAENGDSDDAAR